MTTCDYYIGSVIFHQAWGHSICFKINIEYIQKLSKSIKFGWGKFGNIVICQFAEASLHTVFTTQVAVGYSAIFYPMNLQPHT